MLNQIIVLFFGMTSSKILVAKRFGVGSLSASLPSLISFGVAPFGVTSAQIGHTQYSLSILSLCSVALLTLLITLGLRPGIIATPFRWPSPRVYSQCRY